MKISRFLIPLILAAIVFLILRLLGTPLGSALPFLNSTGFATIVAFLTAIALAVGAQIKDARITQAFQNGTGRMAACLVESLDQFDAYMVDYAHQDPAKRPIRFDGAAIPMTHRLMIDMNNMASRLNTALDRVTSKDDETFETLIAARNHIQAGLSGMSDLLRVFEKEAASMADPYEIKPARVPPFEAGRAARLSAREALTTLLDEYRYRSRTVRQRLKDRL